MSKAGIFIRLYEESSLDSILSQTPEFPKRDFHFNLGAILDHPQDFNIITQKVDDFSTMKHATDPWLYIVANLNKDYYIENAKVRVEKGEIRVSNKRIDAAYDSEGDLIRIYTNKDGIESDETASLEDIFIKGCSRQLTYVLQLTFK